MHDGEQMDGSTLVRAAQNTVNEERGTTSAGGKVLYLYSGPRRDADGFSTFCKENSMLCDYIDKEIDECHDMLDQQVWDGLDAKLPEYDGYLMSPPCSTFTSARNENDGGPRPLRTAVGVERYGRNDATPQERLRVREGTLLSLRARDVAMKAQKVNKPWVLEQPHWREGKTSMFCLDEFQELLDQEGVRIYTLAQCRFGAQAEKLTDLVSNRDLSDLELRCNHPPQWWRIPWSGELIYSAHPPLKGKQMAVPASEWSSTMLRNKEPEGPYITRAFAAYPSGLNSALASKFSMWLKQEMPQPLARSQVPNTAASQDDRISLNTRFDMTSCLRGQQRPEEPPSDRWSLRNVYSSMTNRSKFIGIQIGNLIERELDASPQVEQAIVEGFGKPLGEEAYLTQWLDDVRTKLADLLQRNRLDGMPCECDTSPIDTGTYQTVVRGRLLEYWALTTQDPAAVAARWLFEGAPAGLSMDIELGELCAKVDDDSPELDDVALATDYDTFNNYEGVETNVDAVAAIQNYHSKGYLRECQNLTETTEFLGAKPTLSKLGCIVKEKVNTDTGQATRKTRIILDCKKSQVSRYASRSHKSALPRVTDAVQSAMKLMHSCCAQESVTLFIADVADAFWLIPLHHKERRYFVAKLKEKFYVFLRTAQGSRGAPLTFSVIMALAARFVQSTLCRSNSKDAVPEGLMHVYVDDPLTILRGTEVRQRRLACMISVAWMLLGIPMAFHKAVLAKAVVWIGVALETTQTEVVVEVPEAKVAELLNLIQEAMSMNVIPVKKLHTLVGKCMAIASVLYVWRPFLQVLYAALHGPNKAPNNCIWTKQVVHTLVWLRAFLRCEAGSIKRVYSVEQYYNVGARVQITWDASPYGMGAFLTVDGNVREHFAIPISADDECILEAKAGGCEAQQLWECLAGLIAMRLWAQHWKQARVHLYLRGDNMSSLVLFSTLKTQSKQLATLAREFSLDLGTASFKPEVVQHLPGIANVVADSLSRKYEPGRRYVHHCSPSMPSRFERSHTPTKNKVMVEISGRPLHAGHTKSTIRGMD